MTGAWFAAAVIALSAYHLQRARHDRRRAAAITTTEIDSLPLDRQPRVSILVAAWNESGRLAGHIASIRRLRYPGVEYIVCAGGHDDTLAVAQSEVGEHGIVIEQIPGEGKQKALRRALTHAAGEIIFLTDADCIVSDTAFERTIAPIVNGRAQAVTGRWRPFQADIDNNPFVAGQWAAHYASESQQREVSRGLLGRNCALSREALRRAGDFGADVPTGTDYHLARRLRAADETILFARTSVVESSSPTSIASYMRQQRRWLRNHWIHATATGETELQRHAIQTWAAGVVILAFPLVALAFDARLLLIELLMLAHGTANRIRNVRAGATEERLRVPLRAYLVLPISLLIDSLAWTGSLVEMSSRRARGSW